MCSCLRRLDFPMVPDFILRDDMPCQNSIRSDISHHNLCTIKRREQRINLNLPMVWKCFFKYVVMARHHSFLVNPQNVCCLFFFPTKYCRLPTFIRKYSFLSSFSAVIHTPFFSCLWMPQFLWHAWCNHSPSDNSGSRRLSKGGELWIVQDVMDWWWLMIAWTWRVAWGSSGFERTDASCVGIF